MIVYSIKGIMAGILINNLAKWYDDNPVLLDIDLQINKGEFLVILGPSGCGKTTTLRCVAGIAEPSGGQIYFGKREVYSEISGINIPAKNRDVGYVFQNYALYPHMTVFKNVAFGLKIRHTPKAELKSRVQAALRIVELEAFADRRPRELSGGQQQRVAVARVIVRDPSILLFDEPLSNLDPKLRGHMRKHILSVHKKLQATSIYVTHDQQEAMMMADRIAVMHGGQIVQVGTADEIYHYPATKEVASFTGNPKTNLIEGQIYQTPKQTILVPSEDPYCFIPLPKDSSSLTGREVIIHVRPEDIRIIPDPTEDEGRMQVILSTVQGAEGLTYLRLGEKQNQIIARGDTRESLQYRANQPVGIRFRRGNIYDRYEDRLILSFDNREQLNAASGM
jgi:ABC-type sugar transport system ATPase subunit